MLHPQLHAFLCAAECGSFSKAGKKLFLSPTAVMKQVNALEERLDLKLVERTPHGVRLTRAGEIIYRDAHFLDDYARRSISNARQAMAEESRAFCVGASLLYPAKPFMNLWYQVCRSFADYRIHLVPFNDDRNGILAKIARLGEDYDFLYGVCDSTYWLERCSFLPLGYCRKMCAVPRGHRLAEKKRLSVSDLYGETLMMIPAGHSGLNNRIREDLTRGHPQIHIEDTPMFYDISVFNRCAETGHVLLTMDCWTDVHPLLVSIPVDWDYRMPCGLLYAKNPPDDVLRFVNTVKALHGAAGQGADSLTS